MNLEGGVLIRGEAITEMKKLPPSSIDLILTDPPYGHNNNNGDLIARWEEALGHGPSPKREYRPISNDGPEANDLFRAFLIEARRVLKPDGCCCCCCCGGGGPDPQFARWSLWMDEILSFKMCVVWDKRGLGMGWHYRRNWECVLVAEKTKGGARWYGGNSVPNVVHFPKIIPSTTQHPTQKPVELMEFFILNHTLPDEVVLDPFAGAGTTLLAAKKLERQYIGIEIEERWITMATQRLEKWQGQKRLLEPPRPGGKP